MHHLLDTPQPQSIRAFRHMREQDVFSPCLHISEFVVTAQGSGFEEEGGVIVVRSFAHYGNENMG